MTVGRDLRSAASAMGTATSQSTLHRFSLGYQYQPRAVSKESRESTRTVHANAGTHTYERVVVKEEAERGRIRIPRAHISRYTQEHLKCYLGTGFNIADMRVGVGVATMGRHIYCQQVNIMFRVGLDVVHHTTGMFHSQGRLSYAQLVPIKQIWRRLYKCKGHCPYSNSHMEESV